MNYHILTQSSEMALRGRDRDSAVVVFHFSVPSGNNDAGVSYQTAMKEMQEMEQGTIVSSCPFISAGELTDLQNGVVYERMETVDFEPGMDEAAKVSVIGARWTALNSELQTEFGELLKYWGRSANV